MKLVPIPNLYAFARQFFHFGLVGAVGFLVDWASTSILSSYIPLKIAVLFAYIIAASSNWFLNRLWTFRHSNHATLSVFQQWKRFLLANLPGFFINRGVVLLLLANISATHRWPVLALLSGTACGMFVNFTLCRTCVFTSKHHDALNVVPSTRDRV